MGGAGIQADIRTISSLNVHAMTVLTAVTAQNSIEIAEVCPLSPEFIIRQIKTVISDQLPDAIKIGMLFNGEIIKGIAQVLGQSGIKSIVLDPVIKASTGKNLLDPIGIPLLKEMLFPLVRVVTPNLDEAGALINKKIRTRKDMKKAAKEIKTFGPDVVITGGHMQKDNIDLLYDGNDFYDFPAGHIDSRNTHGSGCVFSSSLAVFLATGYEMRDAVAKAHVFTRESILRGYPCGKGPGTLNPGVYK